MGHRDIDPVESLVVDLFSFVLIVGSVAAVTYAARALLWWLS